MANFSAGLGDALLLGYGDNLRKGWADVLGIDDYVDPCSTSYNAGAWSSFALGVGRLGYAGLAKAGSLFASSGAAASAFRDGLKNAFRLGVGKGWRSPNASKYASDAALRSAAGRTNPAINAYGAGVAAAGASGATQ